MFCHLFTDHTSEQSHLVSSLGSVPFRQWSTPKQSISETTRLINKASYSTCEKEARANPNPSGFSAIHRLNKPGYKHTCIEVYLWFIHELEEGLKIKSDAFCLLQVLTKMQTHKAHPNCLLQDSSFLFL